MFPCYLLFPLEIVDCDKRLESYWTYPQTRTTAVSTTMCFHITNEEKPYPLQWCECLGISGIIEKCNPLGILIKIEF